MDKVFLRELIESSQESEIVEFKEAKRNFDTDDFGKYFSALANEANLLGQSSAVLVFGVSDDKKVVGTQYRNSPQQLNNLKKEIADQTSVRHTLKNIEEVYYEGKRVLIFKIPAAPQGIPVAWKGHFYGREGSSLAPLSISKIEQIRAESQDDWSKEIILEATLDDLEPEAIRAARIAFAEKNPALSKELKEWDEVTFLNKAKLTIKGKITRAAIILLGKPESDQFLSPGTSTITWILKDRDGVEKDYQHFSCPLLLNVEKVFQKVRNLKYRYMQDDSIFPVEVDQYDPYLIRESLHNAIAHQDYRLGGKVTIVENEVGSLYISNLGHFIPENIESVLKSNSPESKYRNRFLANAMVGLNMIDTIGSGIRKMFLIQRAKFFPLPEYEITNDRVSVTITGRVLNLAYAKLLAHQPGLGLDDIYWLDQVQKGKAITDEIAKRLRSKRLIVGRKPNYVFSESVIKETGAKAEYIHNKVANTTHYYERSILEYLNEYGPASRKDIEGLLLKKFPEGWPDDKRKNKVRNLIQSLKRAGSIRLESHPRRWVLNKRLKVNE